MEEKDYVMKEKQKTKQCKYCKTEIPYDAKICPQCRKKQKGGILKWIIIAIIVIFVLTKLMSGSSSSTKETSSGNKTAANESGITETSSGNKTEQEEKESEEKTSFEITNTKFNYYKNSIGDTEYNVIVEIENTGTTNLKLSDCSFDFEDKDGHLLGSEGTSMGIGISNCPEIIAPGEKGYFYNNTFGALLDSSINTDNGLYVVPNVKVEKTNKESVRYEVFDTQLTDGDYGPRVTGRIKNTSDKDNSLLYVNVIYYNSNNEAIAINGVTVTDLTAGSTTSFETSWLLSDDTVSINDIDHFEVIAEE